MEFSAKVTRVERALLASFLSVLGAVLWLESRSELAAAIRSGRPWLCAVGGGSSPSALLVYQPAKRSVDLIATPHGFSDELLTELPVSGFSRPLPDVAALAAKAPIGEPSLDLRQAFLERFQGLAFWRSLPNLFNLDRPKTPSLDNMLIAVELHRLPPENLRAAWLPENAEDRRFFFGNIFAPPSASRSGSRAITVEVLNASGKTGVASSATDVLRSQGADVVNVGNAATRQSTAIYDRTGRVENAQAVREMLGCVEARTATQISPKKLVDVTVVLAEDCAAPSRRGKAWNLSKY